MREKDNTPRRWLGAVAIALVLCVGQPNAWADSPSDEAAMEQRRTEAKAKYQSGVDAYSAGRFKDAVDLFLAADHLAPSAPLSFNIARAYEKLGDDAGALRWYRDYLRRSPAASNASTVQTLIASLSAALQKKGVQQLSILTSPAGATVTIDDQPVGVSPWTGELTPGGHHVLVSQRGYVDAQSHVLLPADQPLDQTLRLEQQTVVTAPATAAPSAPANGLSTRPDAPRTAKKLGLVPWLSLGAGAAAMGGALTFELLRRSAESDAKKQHVQLAREDALNVEHSRQTTARIFVGVGGALLAAGGLMLLLDRGGAQATTAGLICVPGTCGFSAQGKF